MEASVGSDRGFFFAAPPKAARYSVNLCRKMIPHFSEEGGLRMGSLSIWHWVVAILVIAGPVMGMIRGVANGSVANAILSWLIPLYGIFYFFMAKQKH